MTYEQFNSYCKKLKATSYVNQWGGSHVWKVGGKVFAIGGWEKIDAPAITFKASDADFTFMQDQPSFRPAPYMASRGMKWLQIYDTVDIENTEVKGFIAQSHSLVAAGLSKKKQRELGLL